MANPAPGDSRWWAVGAAHDAPPGHILHVELEGQEWAVWRDRAGTLHAWENRCPHRGVRLTLGTHLGDGLRCAYHGWQFAAPDGRCRLIPAHPDVRPPDILRPAVLPVVEQLGLIWLAARAGGGEALPGADPFWPLALRSRLANGPIDQVRKHLIWFLALDEQMTLRAGAITARFFLQPVNADATFIHGLHAATPPGGEASQRAQADRLLSAFLEDWQADGPEDRT